MRKLLARLKRTLVRAALVVGSLLFAASTPYADFLWAIPVMALLYLFYRSLTSSGEGSEKYINDHGYVVLTRNNELEHRYIAKQMIGRALAKNEVVHHINGQKTDNQIRNLCLMDREKHEVFHSWLSWKKKKSGGYPSFYDQRRILVNEFAGVLLDELSPPEKTEPPPVIVKAIKTQTDPSLQEKLFAELRDERTRIAKERRLPAYLVFRDKTLLEMSVAMPDCKHAMLDISAITRDKYESYGAQFMVVIRQFKKINGIDQVKKRDPA